MTEKYLKCTRPNGEELIIPAVDDAAVARAFNYSSARGKFHCNPETGALEPYEEIKRENKSAHIITDDIPGGLRCMACRGVHTSKSQMRRCYKERGKIEVGNELAALEIKESAEEKREYEAQLEDDIAWAQNALKYDEAPLDELTKERCKIINNQIENSYGDGRLRTADGRLIDGRD